MDADRNETDPDERRAALSAWLGLLLAVSLMALAGALLAGADDPFTGLPREGLRLLPQEERVELYRRHCVGCEGIDPVIGGRPASLDELLKVLNAPGAGASAKTASFSEAAFGFGLAASIAGSVGGMVLGGLLRTEYGSTPNRIAPLAEWRPQFAVFSLGLVGSLPGAAVFRFSWPRLKPAARQYNAQLRQDLGLQQTRREQARCRAALRAEFVERRSAISRSTRLDAGQRRLAQERLLEQYLRAVDELSVTCPTLGAGSKNHPAP
jgi:hypothetical protein